MRRPPSVAAHEAAHVVVGVALGLRLREARVCRERLPDGRTLEGYAWFAGSPRGRREAFALMYAAGIAHDRALRTPGYSYSWDAAHAREMCSGRLGYEATIKAAAALLQLLREPHARVTAALMERDLRAADILALARGDGVADA